MANRTKFWHFNTSGGFYGELLSNTGLTDTPENRAQALVSTDNGCYHYIVFIKETDQIYTHGNLYDCSTFNGSEVKSLLTGLTSGEILDDDKAMNIIAKLHYLINQNAGNIAVLESEKADKTDFDALKLNVEENEEVTSAAINDLYSKINSVPESTGEENVQSDWNENDVYSDAYIKNKPTIPSAVTSSTVSGWGFTKNTGTYSKPSTGIPKSDLASAVQTSLNKADAAVASVKINGSTKNPSNGVVDLGTVVTDISGKQDKLVSGTNIKTINGNSILGEGDIAVGADNSGKLEAVYPTPVISGSTATYTIPAGVLAFCYQHDDATSVVLNLDCSSFPSEEIYQFHIFVDDISSASLSIGWQGATDSTIWWPNGSAPTLEGSFTTLELSLLGEVYYEDSESYFFAEGAWNRLSPAL